MSGRRQTPAAERTEQNRRLVAQVSAEIGRKVTVREAEAYRRAQRQGLDGAVVTGEQRGNPRGGKDSNAAYLIEDTPVDLTDEQVVYIGTLKARVEDFRILRGHVSALTLTTSTEFRHLLVDAATISRSDLLVAVLYRMPRDLGLDDEEGEGGGDDT